MKSWAEAAFIEELFADVDMRLGAAVPGVQETGDDGGEVRQYRNRAELIVGQVLAGIAVAEEKQVDFDLLSVYKFSFIN